MYQPQRADNAQRIEIVEGGVPAVTPVVTTVPVIDKVHWGAVWAGLMTALTVFLVLDMFFMWIGVLAPRTTAGGVAPSPASGWLPALLALVGFFLGGWLTAASIPWVRSSIAVLNGFLVWALGIVAILAFSTLVSSMMFGPMAAVMNGSPAALRGTGFTLQAAAGWGLLFLLLSAGAAALGGLVGGTTRAAVATNTGSTTKAAA